MDIKDSIKRFSEQELKRVKSNRSLEDTNETVENIDIYQRDTNKRIENNKKSFPRGSSAIVGIALSNVISGNGAEGLAHAYKEAREDDSELRKRGERERAEIRRRQYMEEHFLPAVEIVVNSTSPDEVLNNKKALSELDKYALLVGSGKGYTAAYIRQAYGDQLGQVNGRSDARVESDLRMIRALLSDGEVRNAYGMASRLKKQIDNGDRMANEEDYQVIGRIVAYYS